MDNKYVLEKIENLQNFLLADMPTMIFPRYYVDGQEYLADNFFKTKGEVECYIIEHFNILINKLKDKGYGD